MSLIFSISVKDELSQNNIVVFEAQLALRDIEKFLEKKVFVINILDKFKVYCCRYFYCYLLLLSIFISVNIFYNN
jgi:hypothetical protein